MTDLKRGNRPEWLSADFHKQQDVIHTTIDTYTANADTMKSFLSRLRSQGSSVIELIGAFAERREGVQYLHLIIEEIPRAMRQRICLVAEFPGNELLPDIRMIWPHADWWLKESEAFDGVRFNGSTLQEGVEWQLH